MNLKEIAFTSKEIQAFFVLFFFFFFPFNEEDKSRN